MAPDIRDCRPDEAEALGRLLVRAYSALEGFPSPDDQPAYYERLARVAEWARRPGVRVLVACDDDGALLGGVVYFDDLAEYASGGPADGLPDAAGMRLLAVAPEARGRGVGKVLTEACLALAATSGRSRMVLHTTGAMRVAWAMYEAMGFVHEPTLDFLQGELPVFGFQRPLAPRDLAAGGSSVPPLREAGG